MISANSLVTVFPRTIIIILTTAIKFHAVIRCTDGNRWLNPIIVMSKHIKWVMQRPYIPHCSHLTLHLRLIIKLYYFWSAITADYFGSGRNYHNTFCLRMRKTKKASMHFLIMLRRPPDSTRHIFSERRSFCLLIEKQNYDHFSSLCMIYDRNL